MRLLVWVALAAIVYLAVRSRIRGMQQTMRRAAESDLRATMQKKAAAPAENMVSCAYCHIYLPASDALNLATPSEHLYFCGEEHLRLHRRASQDADMPSSPHE